MEEKMMEIQRKLMEVIIAQRLVKEEDLDLLFEETKKANNVNAEEYDKIVKAIKENIGYNNEDE